MRDNSGINPNIPSSICKNSLEVMMMEAGGENFAACFNYPSTHKTPGNWALHVSA